MRLALLVGSLLALACLAYVLYPVARWRQSGAARGPHTERAAPEEASLRAVSDDEIEAAVRAYRDSHPVISQEAFPASRPADAACPVCGPRPERDPSYCSNCGRPLATAGGA